MPVTGNRSDPLPTFRFRVEIDLPTLAGQIAKLEIGCSECSGLHVETETVEYREGGLNQTVHRFATLTRFPPITLRHGLVDTDPFWDWYAEVMAGRVMRANGVIWLLDATGAEAMRWDFFGAYPTKWSGPDLKADAGTLAFESIELVHKGFTMATAR